jgi:hypothetical protein
MLTSSNCRVRVPKLQVRTTSYDLVTADGPYSLYLFVLLQPAKMSLRSHAGHPPLQSATVGSLIISTHKPYVKHTRSPCSNSQSTASRYLYVYVQNTLPGEIQKAIMQPCNQELRLPKLLSPCCWCKQVLGWQDYFTHDLIRIALRCPLPSEPSQTTGTTTLWAQ